MKDWRRLKPELFKKQPYYRPGCDTYELKAERSRGMRATLAANEKANAGEVLRVKSLFLAYRCLTVVCLQTMRR